MCSSRADGKQNWRSLKVKFNVEAGKADAAVEASRKRKHDDLAGEVANRSAKVVVAFAEGMATYRVMSEQESSFILKTSEMRKAVGAKVEKLEVTMTALQEC
ncbi:hypothetical protein VNO78_11099 [Psophocarpus tetragonolobus]|uniref:Uncharacterized protein n=1 Tax=Psophocarpus tetragonolobus TaxID=3891 RepID=A0AAN9SSZ9_PSOTE